MKVWNWLGLLLLQIQTPLWGSTDSCAESLSLLMGQVRGSIVGRVAMLLPHDIELGIPRADRDAWQNAIQTLQAEIFFLFTIPPALRGRVRKEVAEQFDVSVRMVRDLELFYAISYLGYFPHLYSDLPNETQARIHELERSGWKEGSGVEQGIPPTERDAWEKRIQLLQTEIVSMLLIPPALREPSRKRIADKFNISVDRVRDFETFCTRSHLDSFLRDKNPQPSTTISFSPSNRTKHPRPGYEKAWVQHKADTFRQFKDQGRGALEALSNLKGCGSVTRNVLLELAAPIASEELNQKIQERVTESTADATQIQDAFYWICEAHNHRVDKGESREKIDLAEIHSWGGANLALAILGQPLADESVENIPNSSDSPVKPREGKPTDSKPLEPTNFVPRASKTQITGSSSRYVRLPLARSEAEREALFDLTHRITDRYPERTITFLNKEIGGLWAFETGEGFSDRTAEALLDLAPHLKSLALAEKVRGRVTNKSAGNCARSGAAGLRAAAQQIQDAFYWICEAHNQWLEQGNPGEKITLNEIHSKKGAEAALAILSNSRTKFYTERTKTFLTKNKEGFTPLIQIKGFSKNTATALLSLAPHLQTNTDLQEKIGKRFTNKMVGARVLDPRHPLRIQATLQLQDALLWICEAHNEWVEKNHTGTRIDLNSLSTPEGVQTAKLRLREATAPPRRNPVLR